MLYKALLELSTRLGLLSAKQQKYLQPAMVLKPKRALILLSNQEIVLFLLLVEIHYNMDLLSSSTV